MGKSQPPNRFDLENLEQRILLSGDSLSAATRAIAPDDLDLFDQPFQLPGADLADEGRGVGGIAADPPHVG